MTAITLFIIGLCAGSFALAFTSRLFARQSWALDRSRCDHCKKTLEPIDLIPLLSWLSTSGRCRYCRAPLSKRYPLVELLTGLAWLGSYYWWPYGFTRMGWLMLALWLVMLTLLVSLVLFDLTWQLLPDKVVYTLIGIATFSKLFQIIYFGARERLPGIALGVAVGSGLFWLLYHYSKGRYIGGGDVKYGIFYGVLLGSGFKSLLVISIGSLLGTLVLLPALLTRRTKLSSTIPFGPFLIIATAIVYLFGDKLVDLLTSNYLFP